MPLIGNRGSKGIQAFLSQHVCGALCERLGFLQVEADTDIDKRLPTTLSRMVTMSLPEPEDNPFYTEDPEIDETRKMTGAYYRGISY
jgi:hypothetical protein